MAAILYRGSLDAVNNPNATDTATVDWLEGLGHTVTVIASSTAPDFTGIDLGVIGGQDGASMDDSDRQAWVEWTGPVLCMAMTAAFNMGAMTGAPNSLSSQTAIGLTDPVPDHPIVADSGLVAGSNTVTSSATYIRIEDAVDAETVIAYRVGNVGSSGNQMMTDHAPGAVWTWTTGGRWVLYGVLPVDKWNTLGTAVGDAIISYLLDVPALTVNDMTVGAVFDGDLALTQAGTLSVNDMTVASAFEAPTLVLNPLEPADMAVASTFDGDLALVQANVLAPDDMAVAALFDGITLAGVATLAPDDMAVASLFESPAVVISYTLAPADLAVGSTFDAPTLQQNSLVVADLAVASSFESVVFVFTTEGALVLNGIARACRAYDERDLDRDHQRRGADFRIHAAIHQTAGQGSDTGAKRYTARIELDHLPIATANTLISADLLQPFVVVGGDLPGQQYLCTITQPPQVTALPGEGHNVFIAFAVEAVEGYEVQA